MNAPTESRRALIRRMYHDELCTVGEIAEFLRCSQADVRWALEARRFPAADERRRRDRFSAWTIASPVQPGPLTPSIGLQVRA